MRSLLKKWIPLLASRRLALGLFLVLALLLVPATFFSPPPSFLPQFVRTALALLGGNLLACTARHWRHLQWPVRLLHLGTLLVLIGGVGSGLGYVATVNIHERQQATTAYRWDRNQEMPLGYELHLDRIGRSYYPLPVKIGLLRGGQKVGLLIGSSEQEFLFEGYRIVVSEFDRARETLQVAVSAQDKTRLGTTIAAKEVRANGLPLQFQLVAYQEPQVRRIWADLRLTSQGQLLAAGRVEANQPFCWSGERFFLTATDRDGYGFDYAGLQVVRDPALPVVYGGFLLLVLGGLAFLAPGRGGRARKP